MAEFKFGYDLQYSDHIKTEFEVMVECELTILNRAGDFEVTHTVINQNDDSEIEFLNLNIWDRALISDKAHTPPQRAIDEAFDNYRESLEPQYDKYADNF